MKIAITSKTFSKNEILINELKKYFSDIKLNKSDKLLTKDETIEFLKDCDGAIVALEKMDAEIFRLCPKLKVISKYGVGLDNIDLDDAKTFNIQIGWTGGINKSSVAEMTLAFMLMLCRNLYITSNMLKNNQWHKNGGYSLFGKTVGIIGLGHIGQELVRLLQPFNCTILAYDILDLTTFANSNGVIMVDKDEIFNKSDIVTIHTPLTELTYNIINTHTLSLMQKHAFVINTARGGLIDLQALKYALQNNIIAGAAIDVYDSEPPADRELITIPNLITTPHIGGNSHEAVIAMGMSAIEHLVNFKKVHEDIK